MNPGTEKPYLSIVLAVRNDNYGGDFNLRLQNMLNWNIGLLEQGRISTEFVLVNYNPIEENLPLSQTLQFPANRKFCRIRIVTVPASIHRKLSDPAIRKEVPLYEYIAKNVGIRRANGEYILAANPDILFDPEFISSLSGADLKENLYYRADRCDFHLTAINIHQARRTLASIRSNIFRIFLTGKEWEISPGSFSGLTLWMLRRKNRRRIKKNAWLLKNENYAVQNSLSVNYDNLTDRFHCNCSGDFFLMHRKHWVELFAYNENTYLSIHTDALFVVTAAASGLQEKVFQFPIYHQDHERRYAGNEDKRNEDIRKMFRFFIVEGEKMIANGIPKIYNDEHWGLGNENLTEEIF